MTLWYKRADRNSSFSTREGDGLCSLLDSQHYLGHWEAGYWQVFLRPGVWGEAEGATSIFVHKTQMHRYPDFLPKCLM